MTSANGHLGPETIAALADGGGDVADRRELLRHLAECEACMAAYADAVRTRADWLAAPEGFRAPDEMVRLGIEAGRDSAPHDSPAEVAAPVRPAPWHATPRIAWGLAAVAAVIVAVVWTGWLPRSSAPLVPAAVARGLESCAPGGLVLPGGEAGASREAKAMRSGSVDSVPGLAEAVAQLQSEYESGRRNARIAYGLAAGLLALGQFDAARGYVDEALRSAPQDFRLRLLAADLAYRGSDLVTAERELRRVVQLEPRDPVARLDLALVLAERGERAAAIDLLDRLERDATGPIRERARRERAALGR